MLPRVMLRRSDLKPIEWFTAIKNSSVDFRNGSRLGVKQELLRSFLLRVHELLEHAGYVPNERSRFSR
jgi:hypothetical protein